MPRVFALFVLLAVELGCARTPQLIEYDEQTNKQARSAPLLIVGVASWVVRVGKTVPIDPRIIQ